MKYEELENKDFNLRGMFTQKCPTCEYEHKVVSQADKDPEYYTVVYTFCRCGYMLNWELPVN